MDGLFLKGTSLYLEYLALKEIIKLYIFWLIYIEIIYIILELLSYLYYISHFPGITSLLFTKREVGSFTCTGCYCPVHGTDGLKSPPKDWAEKENI